MRKRVWIGIGAIAIIVLFAGFGTARARQVLNGDQARSSMASARALALHALRLAQRVGLSPSEAAPFRARAGLLAAQPPPAANVLWDAATEAFYQRQARAYRLLRRRIRARIKRATTAARQQAGAYVAAAQAELGNAAALDVDTARYTHGLHQVQLSLAGAHLLRHFRAASVDLAAVRAVLAPANAPRRKTVNAILAANGHSSTATAGLADADARAAGDRIALLGAFTDRSAGYSSDIARLDAEVSAETDPVRAAVKLSDLDAEIASIGVDFQKTVPGQFILVSTEDQWAHVYQDGKPIYSTDVTTGGPELPTDHGIFHIYDKISPFAFHSPWPPGSPHYYLPSPVTYWMTFDRGDTMRRGGRILALARIWRQRTWAMETPSWALMVASISRSTPPSSSGTGRRSEPRWW